MSTARNVMLGAAIAVALTGASVVGLGGDSGSSTPSVISSTSRPFPSVGTVPVVTVKPSPTKSSVRPTGTVKHSAQENTRDSSTSVPNDVSDVVREAVSESVSTSAQTQTSALVRTASVKTKRPKPPPVNFIKGYSYCGKKLSQAQRCINQGKLTLYFPAGVNTLAGHDYKGWAWIDDIPKGHQVVIAKGGLKGTYKVYGHAWVTDKKFPRSGLGADVALQTCEKHGKVNGIGFSFLRRV